MAVLFLGAWLLFAILLSLVIGPAMAGDRIVR